MKTNGALCILLLISMLAGCVTDSTGPTGDPISTGNQTAHERLDLRYSTKFTINSVINDENPGVLTVTLFDHNGVYIGGTSTPVTSTYEFTMWFAPPVPMTVITTFNPYSGDSTTETLLYYRGSFQALSIPTNEWVWEEEFTN